MIRAVKIRLLPTSEQERLFRRSAGAARWAYNSFLAANEEFYRTWKDSKGMTPREVKASVFQKYVIRVLKQTTHQWLKDVGGNVVKRAIANADRAYQAFFKKAAGKPRFKSKRRDKDSFYVNYETLVRTKEGFRGERLGVVKTFRPLPKISGCYSNPHISFDGKYWYLSVCFEVDPRRVQLTDKVIGIDLGVKELAVVSDGTVYHNINKTRRVRRLKKQLRKEKRKASRKLNNNVSSYDVSYIVGEDGKQHQSRRPKWKRPLEECKNLGKQYKKIKLICKRISDIRRNHVHQTTRAIVKTKPLCIVMESLNISGMVKNHHLAKAILEQHWYEFKRQIKYKAEEYGIEVVEVSKFYASSKTCSRCGHIKKDLKLSDRTYQCSECGLVIDRDLNAAINLANYQV